MTEEQPDNLRHGEIHPHLQFAKSTHGEVWILLEKADRTPAEAERMLYAAYASCYHWLYAGTAVNQQRGEWLIARVHTVLGQAGPAWEHARRCLELTLDHPELMEDFDLAFAHEAVARASALAGDYEAAREQLALAKALGSQIQDPQDRQIFFDELQKGDWSGIPVDLS